MSKTDITFGPEMSDFGREMAKQLVQSDYGPGCSFNGVGGHGLESHHGLPPHEQTVFFQQGHPNSDVTFRYVPPPAGSNQ